MSSDKNTQDIIKRLNVIIGLLIDLLNQGKEKKPLMFLMKRLKQLGLENPEIGLFFGKNKEQVAKLIYETKRKKKRGEKAK